jgi:hypothetical protein
MSGSKPYDPAAHLIKIGGADYLPVSERLVWLRSEHPNAILETFHIRLDDGGAIFRCRIELPTGAVSVGHGSETPDDFTDYIEKSESKAIGRALATLGFGAQFVLDAEGRPPRAQRSQEPAKRPQGSNPPKAPAPPASGAPSGPVGLIQAQQRNAVLSIMVADALDDDFLKGFLAEHFGTSDLESLSGAQAGELIRFLQQRRRVAEERANV